MSRPAATRSCTNAASMRAVSAVARAGQPVERRDRHADEDALEHRLIVGGVVEVLGRVRARARRRRAACRSCGSRRRRAPSRAVADRQVRERAQQAAPLGGVAEAVEVAELVLDAVAERDEQQRARRVVDRPGVHVVGVVVRVAAARGRPCGPPSGSACGSRPGRPRSPRPTPAARRSAVGRRRARSSAVPEAVSGSLTSVTSSRSRPRSSAIARGTVSCAAWAWRDSSTATRPP